MGRLLLAAIFVFVAIGAFAVAPSNRGAVAQKTGGADSVYCPAGTCSKAGGNRAPHIKGCSAANCSGGAAKKK